ncbi:MAG: hypothetical protein M1820_002178 [Bogoriella megaspora]|nr:MAG: hypothetical protein M1820_002178 [Bogoriella megaspora]
MAAIFDIDKARSHFKALRLNQCFMDNAGGSQTLDTVADSISKYLMSTNVQLGATYPISSQSTKLVDEGYDAAANYINAESSKNIVLGGATTQLFQNLAASLWDHFSIGDEVVLSQLDHEANIASWVRLATRKSLKIKWWKGSAATDPNTTDPVLTADNLKPLLSKRTKFVACTHTSNILGTIHDIAAISKSMRETSPNALLCVDAVAYAPHRVVDVQALGVDFYSFSWYKVYGPHQAVLYASPRGQAAITSLGHYFNEKGHPNELSNQLGLAAGAYELTASLPKVVEYCSPKEGFWEGVATHEEKLQGILLEYLRGRKDVKILGKKEADRGVRVPVVSFVVEGRRSRDVVEEVERRSEYGIRWGHFYSHRLCTEIFGLPEDDGVVRVSLVHYNSEEEVRGLVKVLDDVLEGRT